MVSECNFALWMHCLYLFLNAADPTIHRYLRFSLLYVTIAGYSCATVYKDTMDLGNAESGRDVYPCVHFQSEVSELWSFDVSTYQWVFLNTSKWQAQAPPPPREQHSSAVVNRNIYVFGGKTRIFAKNADQENVYEHHGDTVYGDLWELSVERAHQYVLHYPNSSAAMSASNMSIPQDARLFAVIDARKDHRVSNYSDGVSIREGLCVDKLVVRVSSYYVFAVLTH